MSGSQASFPMFPFPTADWARRAGTLDDQPCKCGGVVCSHRL